MSGAHHGLRVLLVAAHNRRYHHVGMALAGALRRLGATVTLVDPRRSLAERLGLDTLADRLRRAVRRGPDLVLVFKGDRLAPELVADLRRHSRARWVNWFPDDPHRLDLSLRLGPAYDVFFTHDSPSVQRQRQAGIPSRYLPFGVDPEAFYPDPDPAGRDLEIVFVGSHDPPRAAALAALDGLPLRVWGPRWPRGPLYGRALRRVLAGAAVGLNMHQHFGPSGDPARYGAGANMRVFELAATGTAQLCDERADVRRHLEPDREVVFYRSIPELVAQARGLLDSPTSRADLGAAARRRILAEHTWAHRLEELLATALR